MKRRGKTGAIPSAFIGAALALGLALPVGAAMSADLLPALFSPSAGEKAAAERLRWSIGDTVTREIGGESWQFRCIDEDYSDEMEYHRQGALFLCDQVIPANFGSRYEFETPGDREHDYEYVPGPIVNFGRTSDYKYSAVRSWLKAAESAAEDAEPVNIGVFRAYTGSTAEGVYGGFDGGLTGSYIGSQKMADRLFILSVDEAFRYREWLWRFEGADEDNPESQLGPFCKGYWLRSPVGTGENHDTGLVYAVDLVRGNIHPMPAVPVKQGDTEAADPAEYKKDAEDVEVQVTGTTGVRPAFVLPQT